MLEVNFESDGCDTKQTTCQLMRYTDVVGPSFPQEQTRIKGEICGEYDRLNRQILWIRRPIITVKNYHLLKRIKDTSKFNHKIASMCLFHL